MYPTPTTGVIITGGASGIGLATATALARTGRPVALWDQGADRVREAASGIEGDGPALGLEVDVTDPVAVARAIDQTRSALGSIGGLVHSAGNIIAEPIGEVDWANWGLQLDVHLNSLARLTQDILPDLRQHAGSAIVAISSINGLVAEAFNPAYCTAKAGMLGLTRSMAAHLGPEGIRVNAICPGYIETPMTQMSRSNPQTLQTWRERAALKRLGEPDEIGAVARFLLSGEASFITGQTIVVDGGTTTTA